MRHRVRGRILGRNSAHRKAMFRNMMVSLIHTCRIDETSEAPQPKFSGRITTTVAKAKELRPRIEKLITLARKALPLQAKADELKTSAERNSTEWRAWRESEAWNTWNQAQAQVLALRRRAFSALRDNKAVDILFTELAERFADRNGGYTRILKLANRRLGDGGYQAIVEFVGERDRIKEERTIPVVADEATAEEEDVQEEVAESTTDEVVAEAEANDVEAQDEEEKQA